MRVRRFSLPAGAVALIAGMGLAAPNAGAATCPWMNAQQSAAERTFELLGAMSLSDKIQMVTGQGEFNPTTANPAAAGNIAANPALCIPALVLNDATAGVGDQQQMPRAFPDSIVARACIGLLGPLGDRAGSGAVVLSSMAASSAVRRPAAIPGFGDLTRDRRVRD